MQQFLDKMHQIVGKGIVVIKNKNTWHWIYYLKISQFHYGDPPVVDRCFAAATRQSHVRKGSLSSGRLIYYAPLPIHFPVCWQLLSLSQPATASNCSCRTDYA